MFALLSPPYLARAAASVLAAAALLVPMTAPAQNIAIVNGKAVPKARVDALMAQATSQGQPVTPELEGQVRDEVVLREMFVQEAERQGLPASANYKTQMELARQSILIRELFTDYQKKHPITEADIKAEYDKFKAQASGSEYRASHILVDNEADAKALIVQIKGGASFEELAKKNSKDPGSGERGGDLDWASAGSYVPEFSEAMVKLKKGEMTEAPVKSQFGWHVIKVVDVREAQFPPLDEVKSQIEQRLRQIQMAKYRDDIRARTKTDYKFSN
ncbi:MAG TPA: peptidylprolyl isomerase [Burkholderiaceae bacterium]|nr:peptidylprolyl isomerase [Burkholderiaceae bacterium]